MERDREVVNAVACEFQIGKIISLRELERFGRCGDRCGKSFEELQGFGYDDDGCEGHCFALRSFLASFTASEMINASTIAIYRMIFAIIIYFP